MNVRVLGATVAAILVAVSGCASTPRGDAPANAAAVPAPPAAAPAVDEPAEATLVVRREIVKVCPPLTELRDRAGNIPPGALWIAILDGLAGCMREGELRGRSIVLRGGKPGRDLVVYVLTARGISRERVASEPGPAATNGQVEISLGTVAEAVTATK